LIALGDELRRRRAVDLSLGADVRIGVLDHDQVATHARMDEAEHRVGTGLYIGERDEPVGPIGREAGHATLGLDVFAAVDRTPRLAQLQQAARSGWKIDRATHKSAALGAAVGDRAVGRTQQDPRQTGGWRPRIVGIQDHDRIRDARLVLAPRNADHVERIRGGAEVERVARVDAHRPTEEIRVFEEAATIRLLIGEVDVLDADNERSRRTVDRRRNRGTEGGHRNAAASNGTHTAILTGSVGPSPVSD